MMSSKKDNVFENDYKYRLYRNMYEVIHPTISKKNISNYKIVLDDDIAPVRVFYPNKVSSLKSVIIFIHGDPLITDCVNSYEKICRKMALETNKLVIAIDYKNCSENCFSVGLNECYKTILYLYKALEKNDILSNRIVLMGDSVGANILIGIIEKIRKSKDLKIERVILVYPILDWDIIKDTKNLLLINRVNEFYNKIYDRSSLLYPLKISDLSDFPITLTVVGKADPFREQAFQFNNKLNKINKKNKFVDITFANHGFLNSSDDEIINHFYSAVNDFLTF